MLKRAVIAVAVILLAIVGFAYFGEDHQQYLEFSQRREAWHRRCDAYVDKPATTPEAQACARELSELTAYAKRKGW
jgi:hypothetical protein